MAILRIIIGFCALAVVATLAFGAENSQSYYNQNELLELEKALEQEIAADTMEQRAIIKEEAPTNGDDYQIPSTNGHIDLTGQPLEQPLSNTQIMNSEGEVLYQNKPENNMLLEDMTNNEYFDNPVSVTQSEDLGELSTTPANLESFGILTEDNGGFNQNLWRGVNKKQAEKLLSRIQQNGIKSQTMRLLLQKALLTSASKPTGDGNDWLAERIKTLHALGYAEAGHLLLKDFKSDWITAYPDMAQVWVENLLMTGEPQVACGFTRQHILNENSDFWRQTLLVCQAIDRDDKGLQLSLDLASEEDKKANPLLYSLLNALLKNEETPRLKPNQVFSPLHAVMYSYYPHLMTPDALIRLPDMLLRRIVENTDLSETNRIQAAEKLVNDFAVSEDVTALMGLYTQAKFSKEELANPLGAVENITDGSMARALLWQGIKLTHLASAKALMIKKLWELADNDGFENISSLLTPQTISVAAHPNLAWFAPLAVKSYLKSGQIMLANSWWSLIENNKRPSGELLAAKQHLAPIFAIINGNSQINLNEFINSVKLDTPESIQNVQRILSTLEASNIEVAPSVWLALHEKINDSYTEQGKGPGQLWLRVLGSSLEKENVGETLLLLAEPLMYQHPAQMQAQSVANIITALRFLDLDDDAQNLAMEVILQ